MLKQWILSRNPNVECSPMLAVHWLMTILIMKYFPQQIFMDVSFPTAIWNPSCAPHQVSRILDICIVSSIPDRGGDTGDWYELCDNTVVVLRYVIRWILDPGMKCYVVVVVLVTRSVRGGIKDIFTKLEMSVGKVGVEAVWNWRSDGGGVYLCSLFKCWSSSGMMNGAIAWSWRRNQPASTSLEAENSHLGTLWVKRKLNLAFRIDLAAISLKWTLNRIFN